MIFFLHYLVVILLTHALSANTDGTITQRPDLPLVLHEKRILTFNQPIARFFLDSRCARGTIPNATPHSLLLHATQKGSCLLQVWFSNPATTTELRTLHVYASDQTIPPLQKALAELRETQLFLTGRRWLLQGKLKTPQEAHRVHQLAQDYPQEITNQTEWSTDLQEYFKLKLNQWIQSQSPPPQLTVEPTGQTLKLRGSIPSPQDQLELERQARALAPGLNIQIQSLPTQDPTIYFKVTLLELSAQDAQQLGLDWKTNTAPHAIYHPLAGGLQDTLQIEATLQALAQKGKAKILSRPEIALKIPGEAEFFSGGEFALTTQNRVRSPYQINWKPYGLILHLKSTHTSDTQVRLEISAESSQLHAPAEAASTFPSLKTHRMKTQVDALYDQPLFLSGLYQNIEQNSQQGLPYLSEIPILGPLLFGFTQKSQRQTELIAILIPQKTATPPYALTRQLEENPKTP